MLSLKWNDHNHAFMQNLSAIHTKKDFSDVTLVCDEKLYLSHKLVLSSCSDYFAHMFSSLEAQHPVIVLKDVKPQILEYMLHYMYLGQVAVHQDELEHFMNEAKSLKIKGLCDAGESHVASTDPGFCSNDDKSVSKASGDEKNPTLKIPSPQVSLKPWPCSLESSHNAKKRKLSDVSEESSNCNGPHVAKNEIDDVMDVAVKMEFLSEDSMNIEEVQKSMDTTFKIPVEDFFEETTINENLESNQDYEATQIPLVVPTTRGKEKLLLDGHAYIMDKRNGQASFWRCDKKGGHGLLTRCNGRLKTIDGKVVATPGLHSHPPDLHRIELLKTQHILKLRINEYTGDDKDIITNITEGIPENLIPKKDALNKMIRRERLQVTSANTLS